LGLTLFGWIWRVFGWIWRDARVLSRRRSFDQLNRRCARSIARVQATVALLLDEPLDLLLAPTLLALAPLAQVVIPAALSPTCGTGRSQVVFGGADNNRVTSRK
jgi:hypothetical protein